MTDWQLAWVERRKERRAGSVIEIREVAVWMVCDCPLSSWEPIQTGKPPGRARHGGKKSGGGQRSAPFPSPRGDESGQRPRGLASWRLDRGGLDGDQYKRQGGRTRRGWPACPAARHVQCTPACEGPDQRPERYIARPAVGRAGKHSSAVTHPCACARPRAR